MEPWVVAIVLLAAVLHVVWNVLLKTSGDPIRTAAVGTLAAAAIIAPVAMVAWILERPPLPPTAIAIGIASGAVETAYFVLLSAAYRRGELSVVYPTARGSAPLFAVVVGVAVLGERLDPVGAVGVVALLGGILILQRPWQGFTTDADPRTREAMLLALGTGVAIATYSALDRVGVRQTEPWLYAAVIWVAQSIGLVGWVSLVVRDGAPLTTGIDVRRGAIAGILTLTAYGLILVALSVAPLTVVAPLRESAVVLASGWGALRLREATDRRDALRRIVASGLVLVGIGLLVLG